MNSLIRRRLKPDAQRSNYGDSCAGCAPHRWHGLACNVSLCPCPTSWMEPA
ncbi:hypothetical protein EDD33_2605 [Nocardioides aurantiacus]|uniref:Uncharacterized protein n=1 Tax=Nocardioides aurantiacus TaxID=86796 RepID=A0A3N2CW13_9ACTN|nr:hypothetical protein EDD33_2605 [Nocardioides aurantiacus]